MIQENNDGQNELQKKLDRMRITPAIEGLLRTLDQAGIEFVFYAGIRRQNDDGAEQPHCFAATNLGEDRAMSDSGDQTLLGLRLAQVLHNDMIAAIKTAAIIDGAESVMSYVEGIVKSLLLDTQYERIRGHLQEKLQGVDVDAAISDMSTFLKSRASKGDRVSDMIPELKAKLSKILGIPPDAIEVISDRSGAFRELLDAEKAGDLDFLFPGVPTTEDTHPDSFADMVKPGGGQEDDGQEDDNKPDDKIDFEGGSLPLG